MTFTVEARTETSKTKQLLETMSRIKINAENVALKNKEVRHKSKTAAIGDRIIIEDENGIIMCNKWMHHENGTRQKTNYDNDNEETKKDMEGRTV